MSRGPLVRRALAVTLALAVAAGAGSATAAPKDAQAQKAFKQAMEEDYLDTKFDDAEKKLRGAADACGKSGCAPSVKARLFVGIGIVLAGGKGDPAGAKEAFAEALALDPSAGPDPDYASNDVKKAYDEAVAAAKKKPGPGPSKPTPEEPDGPAAQEGPLALAPLPEQQVNVPVPVYVTMDEETAKKVTSMTLVYVGTSDKKQKEVELERTGRAYRGTIPCKVVSKKGALRYWIEARDRKNKVVATLGAEDEALRTSIVAELEGKPPSWPGFAPPEPCSGGEVDYANSSRMQCVDTKDCPEGESCSNFECLRMTSGEGGKSGGGDEGKPRDDEGDEPDDDADDEEPSDDDVRSNWFSAWFAPDLGMISGTEVCSAAGQNNDKFVCLREDKSRYAGLPTAAQGNNVNFGFGVGTMRVGLAYDRVITEGLTLGARVGFAAGGTSDGGASFLPVHAEGRLGYTIGKNAFSGTGVQPFLFVSGGVAQIDVPVEVQVVEDGDLCEAEDPDDFTSPCTVATSPESTTPETRVQTLTAIKQAGLGFAAAGGGVRFVPADLVAISLGVKFAVTVPVVIPVISPEIALGLGF